MAVEVSKFAAFVSELSNRIGYAFNSEQCERMLHSIQNMSVTELQQPVKVSCAEVDELLAYMKDIYIIGKIPAIKAYRVLTNAGLREAKEAIEKYTVDKV